MYILRGHRLYFEKNIVFLSLKINIVLANSADPDEMLHYAPFQLGLHCLLKYPFRGFWSTQQAFIIPVSSPTWLLPDSSDTCRCSPRLNLPYRR